MEKDEESKRSDLAGSAPEGLSNYQYAIYQQSGEICDAIKDFLSKYESSEGRLWESGSTVDKLGGQLLWVYLPLAQGIEVPISFDLKMRFRSDVDAEALAKFLPQARNDFIKRVPEKLSQALEDLMQESLYPLYQATGKKWRRTAIRRYKQHGEIKNEFIKSELKDGLVVHKKTKNFGAGRPSQWTPLKLERDVKRAAKAVLRNRNKLRLDKVVEEMNKRRDEQSQLTEHALKQALVRNKLKWGTIKRAVIGS